MAMYITAFPSIDRVSQTKIIEDTENTEITVKKKCLERGFTESDLCPFKLKWSFGLNPEVPIINLTTTNRTLLAYACSHIAIIYDYNLKKILPLLSHRNPIKMLSTSRDGKWLLTADSGKDSVVVIWDTEQGVSVCTLFNPHNSEDITVAAISPNAKQIVTVGGGKCQNVHFWLWTCRRDKPDASISLINIAERVKGITFNDKCPEQFALTTDYHVLFLTWNGHVLNYECPKVMAKVQRIGVFNASCYVPEVQQAFTASTNGYVLVWDNVSCKDKHASDDTNYKKKKHRKTLNLQKSSITVIIDNEGMLVTGNSNGRITFYDYQLRFLYWCESYHLDSIRWLSFHLESDLLAPLFVTKRRHLPSKTKIDSKLIVNAEAISQNDKSDKTIETAETIETTLNPLLPSVTLQCSPFNIRNFLVCSSAGIVALMKIPMQKCYFVFRHPVSIVTSMDSHPERSYMVVGDAQGTIHLYNHEKCVLLTSKSTPPLPNYRPILEKQKIEENIIYVTCPQSHKTLKAVTTLKFSPRCDMLVCGLENGAIWILHHITLDPIDEIPYKHSSTAINKIIFTRCAEYMAYTDNALTVVIFKRNHTTVASKYNMWNLIGKYHSHYLPIKDILFGPATSDSDVPRFFSLGEDRELVEYDLAHSGPYPVPGLKILRIDQIEQSAVPLCLAWYPVSGIEKFLMISNSEYKYKIFNDATKTICGTYLGPTFEKPVKYIQILTDKVDNGYMVYATDREIGLQLMPLDGNPYKIVGITGHPQKIIGISVSYNKEMLFTAGYNDPCVLMWKIQLKSVDKMARLGGAGLSPFYCLIKGGKKGWLANEMKAQFYYAQILHQGENTTDARIISDTVDLEQISNLMRAIGYFPTNKEVENIMTEVWYKQIQQYVETGKLIEKITFEEFVRLYVNHRPVFGICMRHVKEAFRTFIEENADSMKNPTLTREQLVDILGGTKTLLEEDKPIGEMLTLQEAYTYLKTLMFPKEEMVETRPSPSQRFTSFNFRFLPARISYKDFIMDIVGVESLEETMADN